MSPTSVELTYEGHCVDTIVGQVTEPDGDGARLVAVRARFDAMTNRTYVVYAPLPLDTELVQLGGVLRVPRDRIGEDGTITAPEQKGRRRGRHR